MNKQALRADVLLLITACIWGFAFVAQSVGMDYVGPFTFNGIRFLLGSLSLLPLVIIRLRKAENRIDPQTGKPLAVKTFVGASFLAGTCLFAAATLQQLGIMHTTAGNSGFITGLYVVLVPIFGIFLGKRTGLPTWVGAVFTLTGLFFLSVAGQIFGAGKFDAGGVRINTGDILTAIGALLWAFHVLIIDCLVKRVDAVALSSGQFACCGLFSCAVALFTETCTMGDVIAGVVPILYGGLCSVGIAYTLQVVAQKYAPPAHATIILSLEGVFAAIGGVLILSEPLGTWTLLGFILIFCGMLSTQWDVIIGGRKKPQ
jgi:drug/metabolite transporter (DMT)-like permease